MTIDKDGKIVNQADLINCLMDTINHLNDLLRLRDNEILDLKMMIFGDGKSYIKEEK